MKTIGFSKIKDASIVKEKFLDNTAIANTETIDEVEKGRIIGYLKNCEMVFSMTLAVFDSESYIGPYAILSDGEWLWPSHFHYYLMKNDFKGVNQDFLKHIRGKNYSPVSLTESKRHPVIVFVEMELLKIGKRS